MISSRKQRAEKSVTFDLFNDSYMIGFEPLRYEPLYSEIYTTVLLY
jgi:hypothetical protein